MAIQTIYTQVDNAKLEQCQKGTTVAPVQTSLLKSNYLGEFRTQAEKDKVLNNLGILGATGKYTYPSDDEISNYKDIKTVQQALDYCIKLIQSYEASDANIKELLADVKEIKSNLAALEVSITNNSTSITEINASIEQINKALKEFDQKLKDLNVDDKITNRINQHLTDSKTIELSENILEVKNSIEENNAVQIKEDGLYVLDNTAQVESNTEAIKILSDNNKYIPVSSGTSPYTVGGITAGTTSESLRGKTISDIIDLMLFPTYVRDLIYPTLSYSYIPNLVEVGSSIFKPELTFIQNDAGPQISTSESILYNGSTYSSSIYNSIGVYTYNGEVSYEAGEYLINNKGEVSTNRVEAGSITASVSTTATYPWYAGTTSTVSKQTLVAFNINSDILLISLNGAAVIKLPGANSKLLSFKVDGGLGYLDVDLDGWEESTEQINGIAYKVWSKKDSYSSALPHQIQFKLVQ